MNAVGYCTLRMILCGALSVALFSAWGLPEASARSPRTAGGQPEVEAPNRPIAAEVYANPGDYFGRQIAVYGLVIKNTDSGSAFWLQDVSERPILVITPGGRRLRKYDQVLVRGKVVMRQGIPVIRANTIEFTKVLGGGGCC